MKSISWKLSQASGMIVVSFYFYNVTLKKSKMNIFDVDLQLKSNFWQL